MTSLADVSTRSSTHSPLAQQCLNSISRQMFNYREALNLPTYSESEGSIGFRYEVQIDVSVDLDDARQRKLESNFNRTRGYESCECNRTRNVVTFHHVDGIRRGDVMRFIRHEVDPNARELV